MENIAQIDQWTAPNIIETLEAHRQTLTLLGVRKLGLFGSYKRGMAGPNSDIDFLVTLEDISFDAYMDTKFYLEDLFQCSVDFLKVHQLGALGQR